MDKLYLAYENPSNGAKPINPFNQLKNKNMSQNWLETANNIIGMPVHAMTGGVFRYGDMLNALTDGNAFGVDRQNLRNANQIAEEKYQTNLSRFGGTALNTNSKQETANSDLDQFMQAVGSIFGNMQQPQNSDLSASDIMNINSNATRENADVARTARFDIAGINEKERNQIAGLSREEQDRNQGYRVQNTKVDAAIQRARDMLLHNQGMQQDMQTRLMNLNDINQNFENSKELNAQQMKDNENQRKYSLAESTLGNIANIYQNNKPVNLLQGMF
jgi:hypothetical protein